MEETNQTLSIIDTIDLTIMVITLSVLFYHMIRKLREINNRSDYPEKQQYNVITACMILTAIVSVIQLIQGDFILAIVWGGNSAIWYWNYGNTKQYFNHKRELYKKQQQDIDLFEKKPTEFTRKKTISEQLDDMLEETKKEN